MTSKTTTGAGPDRAAERGFVVRWEGDLPAGPEAAWDAITARTAGWLWEVTYEPRAGGAEQGIGGGTVVTWEPPRRLVTRSVDGDGGVNQLDYELAPNGDGTTRLRYRHQGVTGADHERELDACRRHTDLYYHSLVEYLGHFAGRDATYVSADGPPSSAAGGFAKLRRALGLPGSVAVGDRVRLTPAGLDPVEGVVDYATDRFLGVRANDALYRFYGRDVWGWPVGVAHHLFQEGGPAAGAHARAWQAWLDGVFASEEAA